MRIRPNRMTTILAGTALLGLLAVFNGPAIAQSQRQESVADAARRSRTQKKAVNKSPRVLTDDDLVGLRKDQAPDQIQTVGAAHEIANATPTKPAAATPSDNGEKLWRQRFAEAYKKLRMAESELNVLEREWNKGQVEYYSDPQKALKEQYTRKDINEHQQKIEIKKKEIEQLRQGISALEDDLRRAGGDAGWSREP